MSEPTPETLLQESGGEVLKNIQGLVQALALYEINNAAVVRITEAVLRALNTWWETGADKLTLQLLPDEYFINGQLLKVNATLYERAALLTSKLMPLDVSEISFLTGTTREDLDRFSADVAKSVRSGKRQFTTEDYGTIRIGNVTGRAIASYRFEPDQLAVWLYISLVELVDRLYAAFEAGETPSLVPLRRTLQLVIDNIAHQRGVYHLLSALPTGEESQPRARQRLAIALEVLGFGQFLGLGPQELMTLSLAGVLGGLTDDPDPDKAVTPIFSYPGIGLAAIPLILAVHGARTMQQGGSAALAGRLLSLAERFVQLGRKRPDQHFARGLKAMAKNPRAGLDPSLIGLFVAYKGPFPPGTIIELADGTRAIAMVYNEAVPRRPVVITVNERGGLGRPIDLSRETQLGVRRVLGAEEAGVSLAKLATESGLDLSQFVRPEENASVEEPEDVGDEPSDDIYVPPDPNAPAEDDEPPPDEPDAPPDEPQELSEEAKAFVQEYGRRQVVAKGEVQAQQQAERRFDAIDLFSFAVVNESTYNRETELSGDVEAPLTD